ncbi:GntR family transcriptional regulator [Streptomyces alkaliphilus]|uniref:GntR family transcriptional regulator n=1 Tax=Streptomyces alkaliphilus TaxID=1472722 RepID=A0A7W3Y124_9ACTN|nr:GntR family transcriptional regulator [Streptomyces alkaliphilus]MBB0244078.1 GntR family transcriptional regulator [Streptomyces alkaliphilus]
MSLDPDDTRPAFQQVSSALRAEILTGKYAAGDQLPSGPELMRRYQVAKATVARALDVLRDDGLIVTKKGKGSFVRQRTERPVGLRPHLESAFEEEAVRIDFTGFSSETLHNAMQEPLDKVRSGRLTPQSISVRLLLPDTSVNMAVPVLADGLKDDPALRHRAGQLAVNYAGGIKHGVEMLAELGLVQSAKVEIRFFRASALFKLYLLNGTEAFFGYYPLRQRKMVVDGEERDFFDITGKDTTLFHHSAGPDDSSLGSQYVQQSQRWFDSTWGSIAFRREDA